MYKSIKYIIIVNLIGGLILAPKNVDATQEDMESSSERYLNCINLTQSSPKLGEAIAKSWINSGGGVPARHCFALALAHKGQYGVAAFELEKIADSLPGLSEQEDLDFLNGDPKDLRIEILGQAGNAWLLANLPHEANTVFSKALLLADDEAPAKLDLYIDRSRALGLLGNYEAALEDLEKAQIIAPEQADIFVYKASAKRLLRRYDEAFSDVELALYRDPENREGLLERGNLRRIKGNITGAQKDWEYLIALYPASASAKSAQKNLDNLLIEEAFKTPLKKDQ